MKRVNVEPAGRAINGQNTMCEEPEQNSALM